MSLGELTCFFLSENLHTIILSNFQYGPQKVCASNLPEMPLPRVVLRVDLPIKQPISGQFSIQCHVYCVCPTNLSRTSARSAAHCFYNACLYACRDALSRSQRTHEQPTRLMELGTSRFRPNLRLYNMFSWNFTSSQKSICTHPLQTCERF